MTRALQIVALALLLGPTAAHATRYGSLREVDAVSLSVVVNPAAQALGQNSQGITKLVSGRLTADGLAISRKSPFRLEVLVDGLTLRSMSEDTVSAGGHVVVVRMVLVRNRNEGALVLWEDLTYGGWIGRDPVEVMSDVEQWLDTMCRDFVLDYYKDAAVDRAAATP